VAGIDVSGFVSSPEQFGGLYKAADTLERRKYQENQVAQQNKAQRLSTSKFLTDYLDPKAHLTGTAYDPQIVKGFQEILQEGADLANQGADASMLMMALGPKVSKLSEYSQKAKAIDASIKESVGKLKSYKGYNTDALADAARRSAFYAPDGSLKDISTVDPSEDYVTNVAATSPETFTTSAGLDDFVNRTPMGETSKEVQTMYAGKKRNVKYEAKAPFWMDLEKDDKGEIAQDAGGNPVGLDVIGETVNGDDGKPMVNEQTGKPYKVMDKDAFNAVMEHNPDIADYVKGQVNTHFKESGGKIPEMNTPQYEMMARHVLYDELKSRNRSSFKTIDKETKTTPATRIELGYSAYSPKGTGKSGSASESTIRDVYDEVNKLTSSAKDGKGAPLNKLSASAQSIILKHANALTGEGLTQADIYVKKEPDGTINILRADDSKVISPIDFEDINIQAQPSVKEKREVISKSKEGKTTNPASTEKKEKINW
jgi:hypothetical protein